MGRHASSEGKDTGRQPALLGWGVFLVVVVLVCSPMLGLQALAAAALGATAAAVFVVLYFLSGVTR